MCSRCVIFNELLLLWATWGQTPVYWAVAKAKGQISPAINATKPAHIHTAVLVYSSYLCGICRRDIILCRSLTTWFILGLITCRGYMKTRKSGEMACWLCFGWCLGAAEGVGSKPSLDYLWWNITRSLSAQFAPILSLHHYSCLLKGIFSSLEKESVTHTKPGRNYLLWHRSGNTAVLRWLSFTYWHNLLLQKNIILRYYDKNGDINIGFTVSSWEAF